MPKFLDHPVWPDDTGLGINVYAVGCPEMHPPYEGAMLMWDGTSYDSITPRTITVNGDNKNNIDVYAPTGPGAYGQILKSNGFGTPFWADGNFNFTTQQIFTTLWTNIAVDDASTPTNTTSGYKALHTIRCHSVSNPELNIFIFPMRSTSTTSVSSFSDVRSLVASQPNGYTGVTGVYEGRIVYGAYAISSIDFNLLCVS